MKSKVKKEKVSKEKEKRNIKDKKRKVEVNYANLKKLVIFFIVFFGIYFLVLFPLSCFNVMIEKINYLNSNVEYVTEVETYANCVEVVKAKDVDFEFLPLEVIQANIEFGQYLKDLFKNLEVVENEIMPNLQQVYYSPNYMEEVTRLKDLNLETLKKYLAMNKHDYASSTLSETNKFTAYYIKKYNFLDYLSKICNNVNVILDKHLQILEIFERNGIVCLTLDDQTDVKTQVRNLGLSNEDQTKVLDLIDQINDVYSKICKSTNNV